MLTRLVAFAALFVAGAAAAQAPPSGGCRYDIALDDPAARRLAVAVTCDGPGPHRLAGHRQIPHDHVRDVAALPGSAVVADAAGWTLRTETGHAGLRYVFDMEDLLANTNSPFIGRRIGRSVLGTIGSFLLAPAGAGRPLVLTFRAPDGAGAAIALPREGDAHRMTTDDLPFAGFFALGRFDLVSIALPGPDGRPAGAVLDVAVLDAPRDLDLAQVKAWIEASAGRVAHFFGGFPVKRGLIVLYPVEGRAGLLRGVVMGGGGASMMLLIGQHATRAQLYGHWMLVHELVHFGAPFIENKHRWLMEGSAVYIESIVRARAGWFGEAQTWRGFVRFMGPGAEAMGGQGLAAATGIAPVYWGGALFMLLADVEIRKRTGGAKTLADCFRAVVAAGGDTAARWTGERFVEICDRGTGTNVFAEMTAKYVHRGTPFDLSAFWRELGIAMEGDRIVTDDRAPLAAIRKSIMRPEPAPQP